MAGTETKSRTSRGKSFTSGVKLVKSLKKKIKHSETTYFNPFNDGNEVFVKRDDIPKLKPIWGDEKGDASKKVYEFINK